MAAISLKRCSQERQHSGTGLMPWHLRVSLEPQRGHSGPSGRRLASEYLAAASPSGMRSVNSAPLESSPYVLIRDDLKKIFHLLPEPFVTGNGPAQLTERGQQVARESGLVAMAARLAPNLGESAKSLEPFEVQELCLKYANDLPEPEEKELARGAFDVGVPKKDLRPVLVMLRRDELLRSQKKRMPVDSRPYPCAPELRRLSATRVR